MTTNTNNLNTNNLNTNNLNTNNLNKRHPSKDVETWQRLIEGTTYKLGMYVATRQVFDDTAHQLVRRIQRYGRNLEASLKKEDEYYDHIYQSKSLTQT